MTWSWSPESRFLYSPVVFTSRNLDERYESEDRQEKDEQEEKESDEEFWSKSLSEDGRVWKKISSFEKLELVHLKSQ